MSIENTDIKLDIFSKDSVEINVEGEEFDEFEEAEDDDIINLDEEIENEENEIKIENINEVIVEINDVEINDGQLKSNEIIEKCASIKEKSSERNHNYLKNMSSGNLDKVVVVASSSRNNIMNMNESELKAGRTVLTRVSYDCLN